MWSITLHRGCVKGIEVGNYIRVVKADEDAGEVETEVVLEMRCAGNTVEVNYSPVGKPSQR